MTFTCRRGVGNIIGRIWGTNWVLFACMSKYQLEEHLGVLADLEVEF